MHLRTRRHESQEGLALVVQQQFGHFGSFGGKGGHVEDVGGRSKGACD